MYESMTDAVLTGFVPLLRNRPIKVTITYAAGMTHILEDDALRVWWEEYNTLRAFHKRMTEGPTPVSSDALREAIEKEEEKQRKQHE